MIHLDQNEKIIMIIHRHWIVLLGKVLAGFFLLLFPFIAIPFIPNVATIAIAPILFFFILYLMIIILLFFIFWFNYYFDAWIITTERIVDINQRGLFNREISEFMLDHVQDVVIDIPGMIATLLKFGDIAIQTAGDKSFTIHQVPNVYEIKNVILDYSKNNATIKNNVGTQ